jgi:hypothetical protein
MVASVTSYLRRYLAGEREAVWDELWALGPVPTRLADDVSAVARETMQRAARHVRRIAEALPGLGHIRRPRGYPLRVPPTAEDHVALDELRTEIGGLPYAFDACLREVGRVSFLGNCPALDLYYDEWPADDGSERAQVLPDPLDLPDVSVLRSRWDDHETWSEDDDYDDESHDGQWRFVFAPDELLKADISGSTYGLYLPDSSADAYLVGDRNKTLVEYLRRSVAWGGFPGWSYDPERAPAALAALRAPIDF